MSAPQSPARGPVFISFASEEQRVADQLLASLEGGDIRCWIAHRDIPAGAAYPDAITSAIQSCAALLLLVSDAANASPHVLREVEMAFNASKPILPVRLSSVMPSTKFQYFISTTQWLDAGVSFDEGDASQVRTSLQRMLAGDRDRAGETAGEVRSDSRWLTGKPVVVGGAVLLAILAFYFLWWRTPPAVESFDAKVASGSSDGPKPTAQVPVTSSTSAETPSATTPPAGERSTAAPASGPRSRENAKDGQVYVFVPAGSFTMGCSQGDSSCDADEQPSHLVRFRKGFWIGKTEITVEQYRAGTGARGGSRGADGSPGLPMTDVSWKDAKRYCGLVGGRLPTEAEWEYAARAGVTTRYYGRLADIAWSEANSDERAHPVATREPNAFGLYDMLGNVHEWVLDRYFNKYDDADDSTELIEPIAPNAMATVRGGAFTSAPPGLRLSARLARYPDEGAPNIGFRCTRN
jgi:formylglycine-generating enzyme required for sulfatase activity